VVEDIIAIEERHSPNNLLPVSTSVYTVGCCSAINGRSDDFY